MTMEIQSPNVAPVIPPPPPPPPLSTRSKKERSRSRSRDNFEVERMNIDDCKATAILQNKYKISNSEKSSVDADENEFIFPTGVPKAIELDMKHVYESTTNQGRGEIGPPPGEEQDYSIPETPIRSNISNSLVGSNGVLDAFPTVETSTSYLSTNPVLALLIGSPPPPPPTPPPVKTPQNKRNKTPGKTRPDPMIASPTPESNTAGDRSAFLFDNETSLVAAQSGSVSTMTQSFEATRGKFNGVDAQDSLLDSRMPTRSPYCDVQTNDPPTGDTQVGLLSSLATPRVAPFNPSMNNDEAHNLNFNRIASNTRGHRWLEEGSPVPEITVRSPIHLNHSMDKLLEREETERTFTESTLPDGYDDKFAQLPDMELESPEVSPSRIRIAKTSVATIAPTIESKKDSDNFHPHFTPSVNKNQNKKYRSKTPDRLRRLNETIAKQPSANQSSNTASGSGAKIKPIESKVATTGGTSTKKGFFQNLFRGKKVKTSEHISSEKSTKHSATTEILIESGMSSPLKVSHSLQLAKAASNESSHNKSSSKSELEHYLQDSTKTKDSARIKPSSRHKIASVNETFHDGHRSNNAEHHDIFVGNDEVSTLTIPTIDSFQVFGHQSFNQHSQHFGHVSSEANIQKNSLEDAFSSRRPEDPSIHSLSTSDPMGSYFEKDFKGISKNVTLSTLSSTPFSTSQSGHVLQQGWNSADNRVDKPSFVNTGIITGLNDPVGQSPIDKISMRSDHVLSTRDTNVAKDPPTSSEHGTNSILSGQRSQQSIQQQPTLKHDISILDPPLNLEELDDTSDDGSTDVECLEFYEEKLPTEPVRKASKQENFQSKSLKSGTRHNLKEAETLLKAKTRKNESLKTKNNANTNAISVSVPANKDVTNTISISRAESSRSASVTRDVDGKEACFVTSKQYLERRRRNKTSSPKQNKQLVVSEKAVVEIDESGPIDSDQVIEVMKARSEIRNTDAVRKAQKQMDVAKAARLNAKTMAYITTLNGEPSPRRKWRQSTSNHVQINTLNESPINTITKAVESPKNNSKQTISFEMHSPTSTKVKSSIIATAKALQSPTNKSKLGTSLIVPSPTSPMDKSPINTTAKNAESPKNDSRILCKEHTPTSAATYLRNRKVKLALRTSPEKSLNKSTDEPLTPVEERLQSSGGTKEVIAGHPISNDPGRLFSAYNPKFKGRIPHSESRKIAVVSPRMKTDFLFVTGVPKHLQLASPRPTLTEKILVTPMGFSRGVTILRENRERNIASGSDKRIVPTIKAKPVRTKRASVYDIEPKDPIHRAGRRLLVKAAVPIQAKIRRFLARREAVDRMWGLLEMQSYFRRWKAEASFLAYREATVHIQRIYRGCRLRNAIQMRTEAAITLQRYIRGFLIAVTTYDLVYRIILVQNQIRGLICRNRLRRLRKEKQVTSTTRIQTWWRQCSIALQFRYLVIDTITAQCAIRRWAAVRRVQYLRDENRTLAAIKIQSSWRRFQFYTDYLFCMVDVLLCQKVSRSWLARRRTTCIRQERASLRIQTKWRQFAAYKSFIICLVYILILQRNSRKWNAENKYRRMISNKRENDSAVLIQSQWRSFVAQMIALQRLVQVIMVQSIARRFLSYQHTAILRHNRVIQSTVSIQACWRRFHSMQIYRSNIKEHSAAVSIESNWRRYQARSVFKQYLAAVAIESAWRRYQARSVFKQYLAAVAIESAWRRYHARSVFKQHLAAVVIDSAWRRYRTRSVFKVHFAAVVIESAWRRHQARSEYVEMNIVRKAAVKIQSGLRRYRAQSEYMGMIQVREAAVKIQSAWRRFWDFSHYIILLYEIVKVQSRVRARLAVENYNLQLGCCILLQSVLRGYLARKYFFRLRETWTMSLTAKERQIIVDNKIKRWRRSLLENDKDVTIFLRPMLILAMKERIAAKKIQCLWKPLYSYRREKKAALVIERFFLLIQAEIELEIVRREKRRSTKSKSRREGKRRGTEDRSLDLADSSHSQDTHSVSPIKKNKNIGKSTQPQHNDDRRLVTHRASSPSMNLVMRHENDKDADTASPSGTVQVTEDSSIVSGLTFLTSTSPRHLKQHRKIPYNKKDEQMQTIRPGVADGRISRSRLESMQTESAADKYMKMYGIKAGGTRSTGKGHFFGDDVESIASSIRPNFSTKTDNSSQKGRNSVSDRKQSATNRALTLDTMQSPAETTSVRKVTRRYSGSHAGSSTSSAFHYAAQDTWPANHDSNDQSEYLNHHKSYSAVPPVRLHAISGRPTAQYPYYGDPSLSQSSMPYRAPDLIPSEPSYSMGSMRAKSERQLYQPGYSNQILDLQRSRSVLSGVQHSMNMPSYDQRPRSTGKVRSNEPDDHRLSQQEELEKHSRSEKYDSQRESRSNSRSYRRSATESPSNPQFEKSLVIETQSKSSSRGRTSQNEKRHEKTTPNNSSSSRRRNIDRNSYGVI